MNKLLYTLTAGAAALVLTSGICVAADQTRPNEEAPPRASENQPGDAGPVTTGPEDAKQNQEHMAAMKKCNAMNDGQKQKCVEAAQKKYGHM